jgi:acetyl-CoA carboxylase carboxyl transferase subunit alpha
MTKHKRHASTASSASGGPRNGQKYTLNFEQDVVSLEEKIQELRNLAAKGIDLEDEIKVLERKLEHAQKHIYSNLTPWQHVQLSRHPLRPYTLDYIKAMIQDFTEIHGDRLYGDDKALITGFGYMGGRKVCVIGHQKGRDTKENLMRMFGSAHPEGYRKALRVMRMAEKFNIPILCFVDTPGAYPGIGAEERGQASAIAWNLREMADVSVPIIVTVIGEGGSGGALGIGVGDRVFILENAYYSVISPEGCAAILWKDNAKAGDAAEALKLTAEDLLDLGVIDAVIPEPLGGAHHDIGFTASHLAKKIESSLEELEKLSPEKLLEARYQKFRKMGVFVEPKS